MSGIVEEVGGVEKGKIITRYVILEKNSINEKKISQVWSCTFVTPEHQERTDRCIIRACQTIILAYLVSSRSKNPATDKNILETKPSKNTKQTN